MNELKVTNENITHTDHIVVNANDINLHISAENTLKQNFTEQQTSPHLQINPEMIAEIARQSDAEKKADMDKAYRYFFKGWILRKIAIFSGLTFGFLPIVATFYYVIWGWDWTNEETFILTVAGISILCAIICLFSILFWLNNHNKANEILARYNQEIPL